MKFLMLLFLLLLMFSCENSENPLVVTQDDITADSLEQVADSLMKAREMHALTSGAHIHAPGSNLAATAHQNPEKKKRMRRNEIKSREARKAAARARAKRFSVTMKNK